MVSRLQVEKHCRISSRRERAGICWWPLHAKPQARTLQTVADLKSDIEAKERIPVQEQSLIFQDESRTQLQAKLSRCDALQIATAAVVFVCPRTLQNSRRLHECGIRHDAQLH